MLTKISNVTDQSSRPRACVREGKPVCSVLVWVCVNRVSAVWSLLVTLSKRVWVPFEVFTLKNRHVCGSGCSTHRSLVCVLAARPALFNHAIKAPSQTLKWACVSSCLFFFPKPLFNYPIVSFNNAIICLRSVHSFQNGWRQIIDGLPCDS